VERIVVDANVLVSALFGGTGASRTVFRSCLQRRCYPRMGEIVTGNTRDLRGGELKFPRLRIETPTEFLKRWRKDYGNDDDSNS